VDRDQIGEACRLMSSIDIEAHEFILVAYYGGVDMGSSLHVSLPDEMRAFVDLRSNDGKDYSTPSEYIRALIRKDMETEAERLFVFKEILKFVEDIRSGSLISSDEFEAETEDMFAQWDKDDADSGK
jgi:antitoxin ParD1/3/4